MRPSRWGGRRTLAAAALAAGVATVAVTGCSPADPERPVVAVTAPTAGTGCRALAPTVRPTVTDQPTRARIGSVLDSFASRAWNPQAPAVKPSRTAGGLYVNYRPTFNGVSDAASQTNVNTDGLSDSDANKDSRHDPLTDLAILRDLDAAAAGGISSPATERLRCLLQPVTAVEFGNYGPARGFVYGQLTDLAELDPDGPWNDEARRFALNLAKIYSDPTGLGRTQSKPEVRSDWIAESAAALVDAGSRFDTPAWGTLGQRLADELVSRVADPKTGLFPGSVSVDVAGRLTVTDPLARTGAQAQLLDALLTVAGRTGDSALRAAVEKALSTIESPGTGLVDPAHGGWFFAIAADGTDLRTAYKETRSAWMLPLLQHAENAGLSQQAVPSGVAQATVQLVRDSMYLDSAGGYVYRLAGDWTVYRDPGRSAAVAENWVTSEATGIAVDVLLGDLS